MLLVALVCSVALAGALPLHAQDGGEPASGDDVVSLVNGTPITRADFHARVQFVRWQYLNELEKLYELTNGNLSLVPDYTTTLIYNLQDADVLGEAVLAQMEDELLLWQASESLGVVPTLEDSQLTEATFFSRWTDVDVEDIPTSETAQAFIRDWYAGATAASGLREDDIRELFATEALRSALYVFIVDKVPAEELAVNSRHILCAWHPDNLRDLTEPTPEQRAAAETCIESVQARLAAGDAFATVAQDLSDDRGTAAEGGNLDWILISYLTLNFADAVRDAELNTVIGPVETEFGLHMVEVLDRRMQALTEAEYAESQRGYFDLWLGTQRDDATLERSAGWNAALPTTPGFDTLSAEIQEAVSAFTQ